MFLSKITGLCFLALVFSVFHSADSAQAKGSSDASSYRIVLCGSRSVLLDKAGSEFTRFAEKITGQNIAQPNYSDNPDMNCSLVIIGNVSSPVISRMIKEKVIPPLSEKGYDQFNIISTVLNGRSFLFLYGSTENSILYAVYDYLENQCGAGFFQDGMKIPRLSKLPADNIKVISYSPVEKRMIFAWHGWELPKKFHSCFWTIEEWKAFIDWAVRKKYNVLRLEFNPIITNSMGDIIELAIPDYKSTGGSWPGDYRRELNKQILRYARASGLKTALVLQYGMWPDDFTLIEKADRWNSRADDPNTAALTKRIWKKFVDEYGTDHMFVLSYACETPHLKKQFAKGYNQAYKIIREIDPGCEIWIDGWCLFFTAFNREEFDEFEALLPKDIAILDFLGYNDYQDTTHRGGMYRYFNYFNGRPWGLAYVTNFSGEDTTHIEPNMAYYQEHFAQLAGEGVSNRLKMAAYLPENVGCNIMISDYFARLIWNASDVNACSFPGRYLQCRYGTRSEELNKALSLWISGMEKLKKSNGKSLREFGDTLSPLVMLLQCFQTENNPHSTSELAVEKLSQSLLLFNKAAEADEEIYQNQLYQKDMVELFKLYCQELFYLPVMRTADQYYASISAGPDANSVQCSINSIEGENEKVRILYEGLEAVLSTQEDYYLYEDLKEITSVDRTVPGLDKFLKWKHIMDVDKYARNISYETIHFVYWPEVDAYFQVILDDLRSGVKKPLKADDKRLTEKWKKIREGFSSSSIKLNQSPYLTGITASKSSDIIKVVLEKYAQAGLSASDYNDLYSEKAKKHYFPFINLKSFAK